MTMTQSNPKIQLLQCEADDNYDSYFRLLVNGTHIKYLTIAPGLYDTLDLCFEPRLIELLPRLPPGDWNDGIVSLDTTTNRPRFSSVTRKQFQGVESAWHPTRVDHLSLNYNRYMLASGVLEATWPLFQASVVAKFARFEWEITYREKECEAYEWIEGQCIGPKFLGYLTEEGRTVGFIVEKVADFRHATLDDLDVCRESLSRLHRLGVVHGDTNKHNFLITNGRAVLIDFEGAWKSDDGAEFEKEMAGLPAQLADMSGRGGSYEIFDDEDFQQHPQNCDGIEEQ